MKDDVWSAIGTLLAIIGFIWAAIFIFSGGVMPLPYSLVALAYVAKSEAYWKRRKNALN